MDPISLGIGAGSALIGGISSLFGSKKTNKSNLQATRETNEMNYKIARETNLLNRELNWTNNEFNERMANQANKWNIEQWNRENEYNSPAAQRARMEAAGFNPNVMADSFQPSVASSLQSAQASASSANPMVAPTMQAPHFENEAAGLSSALLGIPSMIAQSTEASKSSAETQGVLLDNLKKAAELKFVNPMAEVTFQTALQQYHQSVADAKVASSTVDFKVRSSAAQARLDEANAKLQEMNVNAFPERFRNEMNNIVASTSQLIAREKLTKQQAQTEIKKRLLLAAQTRDTNAHVEVNKAQARHLSVSADQIEELTPILVDKAISEADIAAVNSEWQNDLNAADYANKSRTTLTQSGSASILGVGGSVSTSSQHFNDPRNNSQFNHRANAKNKHARERERRVHLKNKKK